MPAIRIDIISSLTTEIETVGPPRRTGSCGAYADTAPPRACPDMPPEPRSVPGISLRDARSPGRAPVADPRAQSFMIVDDPISDSRLMGHAVVAADLRKRFAAGHAPDPEAIYFLLYLSRISLSSISANAKGDGGQPDREQEKDSGNCVDRRVEGRAHLAPYKGRNSIAATDGE